MNFAHTPRLYHPVSAGLFSSAIIVGAYASPNLALTLSVTCIAAIITSSLIDTRRSRITFMWIVSVCVIFSVVRLALIAVTTHSETSTFALPQITFPSWLGSLVLGGSVDTHVIVTSAQSMALLTSVIIGCCAFSFLIGPHRIVHLIPRKLTSLRESTQVASNVMWRTPNEVRLINEAQYNHRSSKFSSARYVFPAFVSELVNQSTTHAGVADLRKSAITRQVSWYRFTFSHSDTHLIGLTLSLGVAFLGVWMMVHP